VTDASGAEVLDAGCGCCTNPEEAVSPEDAALIVKAVNYHTELLAALKGMLREADRDTIPFIAARALIARIEGK
jgi:predicted RNA methylase